MKKLTLLFNTISLPVDFLALLGAGILAYLIRYNKTVVELRPIVFDLPFKNYFLMVILVSFISLLFFAFVGLYSLKRKNSFLNDFIKIIEACSLSLTAITFFIFFSRELFSSRFIVLIAWILAIILVSLSRFLLLIIRNNLLKKDIGLKPIVIIGNDKVCHFFCKGIEKKEILGYKIVANFKTIDETNKKQLLDLIKERKISEIIQVGAVLDKGITEVLLDISDEYNLPFKYAADLLAMQSLKFEINTIGSLPFLEFKKTPLEGWQQVYKRILDLIGSTVGIILFGPIMLVIAILIKLDSKGPIIYKNKRVSQEKDFFVYKFRTMKIEACTGEGYDNNGQAEKLEAELIKEKNARIDSPVYKIVGDPRRTKLGSFLEKTSLDELPQFFNVFLGQMSLVGPRPHQPREVAKYAKHHKKVLAIKPGLTGISQVSGRSDLPFEEEVRLDRFYIENWNLWLDLAIIIKTPIAVLFKKHKS